MPYNTPDSLVWSSAGAKSAVTDLTASVAQTGPLNGAKVDLFVNNFTPTPSNVIGDFTIPTAGSWASYVQKTVTGWGAQAVGADGRVSVEASNLMEWTGPVAGSGPTVYGYVVRDAAANLLYSVKFATPKTMVDVNSVLDLVVSFTFPNVQ